MRRRTLNVVVNAFLGALAVTTAWAQQPIDTQSLEGAIAAAGYDGVATPPVVDPAPTFEPADAARVDQLEARINELEYAQMVQQTQPAPKPASNSSQMSAGWGDNGFTAETANKNFKIHVGGRVQLDAVALSSDDLVLGGVGDDDAVNFRRARFRIDGTMYQTMEWCAEFDFVNGQDFDPANGASPVTPFGGDVGHVVAPTDLWWLFHDVPLVGNVRIGNQKEPIGLEHLCSSRFLDFMERSYLQDAFFGPFNNGFTPGINLQDWNESETVNWSIGGYRNTQNVYAYDTGDNEYALTGRLACVPLAADDDRELVHLGLAASYRGLDQDVDPTAGNLRIRSRASLRNGPGPLNPVLADTNFAGRLFADNETLLAPEVAVVAGPLFAAAEYVSGYANGAIFTPIAGAPIDIGQAHFQGSYVQVLYFLTGEHRAYDRHEGRFGRVKPNTNAVPGSGGSGAWQIGARYGFLDLMDADVDGGYIEDLTVGLNWFLNPFAKFQFNYVLQQVDNTQRNAAGAVTADNDGELHGFGVRFAQDF